MMTSRLIVVFLFFFFQAEDGIRDYKVTGVQTCALPIFKEIAEDVLARHQGAGVLPDHGRIRYRRDGEDHGWSPPLVRALQHAEYTGFADGVRARAPAGPRDLLDFREQTPVPLDAVEPAEH